MTLRLRRVRINGTIVCRVGGGVPRLSLSLKFDADGVRDLEVLWEDSERALCRGRGCNQGGGLAEPPFYPAQLQVRGPAPLTDEAAPALHRSVLTPYSQQRRCSNCRCRFSTTAVALQALTCGNDLDIAVRRSMKTAGSRRNARIEPWPGRLLYQRQRGRVAGASVGWKLVVDDRIARDRWTRSSEW